MSDPTPPASFSLDELDTLAAAVGRAAVQRGWRLATAESCTGGLIARALTEVAGSSAWMDCGFVTYSNESKTALLGVPGELIQSQGAVSEAVAAAMAEGARKRSGAMLTLSVTGIAGPGGAVPGKPVGTVCFGWGLPSGGVETEAAHFVGDRRQVRMAAARHALLGLALRAGLGLVPDARN